MNREKKYYTIFKGIRLKKNEGNKIASALIFGFLAIPIGLFLEKVVFKIPIGLFIVLFSALFGYLVIGSLFKKTSK